MLQLDNFCDHCFSVGCGGGGYVQILKFDDFILWKEPIICNSNDEGLYFSAQGLRCGTIFWPQDLYFQFLKKFGSRYDYYDDYEKIFKNYELPVSQAKDLWRINGSRSINSSTIDLYSLEELEEKFDFMYFEDYDYEKCLQLYNTAKKQLDTAQKAQIVILPNNAASLVITFQILGKYLEWSTLSYVNNQFYYPVGDNFAVVIV